MEELVLEASGGKGRDERNSIVYLKCENEGQSHTVMKVETAMIMYLVPRFHLPSYRFH